MTQPSARPVRLINYLAYGGNDVLGAGSMAIVSGWVLLFYTRFCGLSAAQAAIIFATARVLDAVFSPLMGHLSDHFGRTALGRRFGRRRVFILAAVPLLPSFALMWLPGQQFWYYLVSYVAFELVYALEIIPYETLAAEMASDYATKARFAGARIVFGQVSAILAGFMPMWLIGWLGRDSAATFFWMGAIFAGLFMIVALILYAFSWERPPADHMAHAPVPLLQDLAATMKVRAFRLHLGMYLGGYISQDIFNAAFTFFVIFALGGTTAHASSLLGSLYMVQLVAVGLAIWGTLRASPAGAYALAAGCFAAGTTLLVSLWWRGVQVGDAWIWVAIGLAGLGRGALNYIPWATYNYIADVDEIMTGRRREGSFAGVMTFVRKATQAAAVALVGLALDAGGFHAMAATQSAQAMTVLAAVLGLGTLIVLAGGVLVSRRFRLDRHTHAILMQEIEHLRGGATLPSSSMAQGVVEDLTGIPYAQVWGRRPAHCP